MSAWDEKTPAGVPGLGTPPMNPVLAVLQQMMQAKQMNMPKAAGTPGQPGTLTPGPMQPGQTGGGMGSGGTPLQKSAGVAPSTAMPQIPMVSQNGFTSGGDRNKGLIADSIGSIFNAVQTKKQQNEQKQAIAAENTWNQLLEAQKTLKENPNDQGAKGTIDEILSDKKRMKAVEESLQIFLPKEGGDEQTPATHGAHSAIKKFMAKAASTMDPRTQAQRMPQGPGAAPNTPGGYKFQFPQPSAMQTAAQNAVSDPANAKKIAEQQLGLAPDANTEARMKVEEEAKKEANRIRADQEKVRLENLEREKKRDEETARHNLATEGLRGTEIQKKRDWTKVPPGRTTVGGSGTIAAQAEYWQKYGVKPGVKTLPMVTSYMSDHQMVPGIPATTKQMSDDANQLSSLAAFGTSLDMLAQNIAVTDDVQFRYTLQKMEDAGPAMRQMLLQTIDDPKQKSYAVAYTDAQDTISSLRKSFGIGGRSEAQYKRLAALIPGANVTDQGMARERLALLRKQIELVSQPVKARLDRFSQKTEKEKAADAAEEQSGPPKGSKIVKFEDIK